MKRIAVALGIALCILAVAAFAQDKKPDVAAFELVFGTSPNLQKGSDVPIVVGMHLDRLSEETCRDIIAAAHTPDNLAAAALKDSSMKRLRDAVAIAKSAKIQTLPDSVRIVLMLYKESLVSDQLQFSCDTMSSTKAL